MELRPFHLERFFARHEFRARHLLCASDCETLTMGELLALEPEAAGAFGRLGLGYTESAGAPALREEIARLYDGIDPDDVLVHAGAEEAIFAFMNVALRPGDHVIVHTPAYQSLHEVARWLGCEVTRWEAREADGWSLDLDDAARSIRRNTRAIIVNCPHNPTGYLMGADDFRALADLAASCGAYLFSDEVYRFLELDPADRLPAACDLSPRAVSLGVMSKSFGLAGLRIGWVATRDRELLGAMAAFKDYLTICNSGPSEFLAGVALRHRDRLVERNLAIVRSNLSLLDRFFGRYAELFGWVRPRAGSVAFPTYRGPEGTERFCVDLVERTGVLLLPSRSFDVGDRHFRIGFGRQTLAAGLERLEEDLTANAGA